MKHEEAIHNSLSTQTQNTILEHEKALQILLSERVIYMSENLNNVRIVKLPAMSIVAYRAESTSPENDCSKVFNKFVLDNNLHKRNGYRNFGFNNLSPSDGNSVYGYEMWVTIPDDETFISDKVAECDKQLDLLEPIKLK